MRTLNIIAPPFFLMIGIGCSSTVQAQRGVLLEDLGVLVKKYAPPAAVHGVATTLPKTITDAASTERARTILIASATSLPKAPYLRISTDGVYRLYQLISGNETK